MRYRPYGLIEHGAHNGIGICSACEQRMLDEDRERLPVEHPFRSEMRTLLNSYAGDYHKNMGHSGAVNDCCAAGCSEAAAVLRGVPEPALNVERLRKRLVAERDAAADKTALLNAERDYWIGVKDGYRRAIEALDAARLSDPSNGS